MAIAISVPALAFALKVQLAAIYGSHFLPVDLNPENLDNRNDRHMEHVFPDPGRLTQNGYIESFKKAL
ncbi:hypothetical protein DCMF_27880 [Candidatus Formimonas warabiya]|uniref:Uncharacterized protein n=1 Tax=Formimonas warabiya TaxID=1761012 RepID=A0A3G1KZV0_FORW1|nr:hypothetical protein DCMF_27880 [Candidatus Formimonas warabiya]